MSQAAQAITRAPADVVRETPVSQAANRICYAVAGEMNISSADLERMVSAVPLAIAVALERKAYYFVPLTVNQGDQTVIADRYDVALSDNAVCHRNLELGNSQCVFISTRLMDDKFSIAFEFYINVGHAFVDHAGVSREFSELVWKQADSRIRGESSLDAWESRKLATGHGTDAEKHKNEYFAAAFSDAISIYLLWSSMSIITTCGSVIILCLHPQLWPNDCAKSRSCSRLIPASISPSTTAEEGSFRPRIFPQSLSP
jgi:hypothetical protein